MASFPRTFGNQNGPIPLSQLDDNFSALSGSGGSTYVGFLQDGTNAVIRESQAKLRDVVSVKDFGAVGDGVTDDTAAISAWLTYLGTSGYRGYVPSGTYILSSAVSVTASSNKSIIIEGAGNESSIFLWTSLTNGITANIPSLAIWYGPCAFEMSGMVLATTQTSTTTVALTVNGNATSGRSTSIIKVSDCTIRGNSATAQWGSGIDYVACSQSNTSFVYIFGANQTQTAYGINISGTATGVSTQHIVDNCQIVFANTAIQCGNYVQGLFVTNCNINQVNYGVSWVSTPAQPELHVCHSQITSLVACILLSNIQFYVISDNALNNFANNGICVKADSCILGDVHNNLFYGGASTTGTIGVDITNTLAVTQTGYWQKIHNNIFSQFASGIVIDVAANNVVASGNIYSVSVTTPTTNNSSTSYVGEYLRNNEAVWSTTTTGARASLLYLGTDNNAYAASGATGGLFVCGQSTVPVTDNTLSSGDATHRWSVVYAGTGTINTSDEREKTDIGDIPDDVLDAWSEVNWSQFRFKDGKRLHVGLVAQRVQAAFERRGIDPFSYGVLCYDAWAAQEAIIGSDGQEISPALMAGDRYGVRYEEALALEAALMRRSLTRLGAK